MTRPLKFPTWATNANYPAGGNPWNGQPTRVDPGAGKQAEGWDGDEQPPADVMNWLQGVTGDWLQYLDANTTGPLQYGDGSDGTVTLNGVATVSWANLVGTVYTLNRDVYCINLTITGAGVVLKTAGFRIFCQGELTTAAGGSIACDGTSASGQSGGGSPANGTLFAGTGGGGGGNASGNGSAGVSTAASYSGSGGVGGTGTVGSAGAAGTATVPAANLGTPRVVDAQVGYLIGPAASPAVVALGAGASGGGGAGGTNGGGAATGVGGGGGGGAGVITICCHFLNLASATDIHCIGGSGAAGRANGGGGGGGGGGGTIILVYVVKAPGLTFTGSGTIGGATANCQGGGGGTGGASGGGNGADGSTGTLLELGAVGSGAVSGPNTAPHVESGRIIADGINASFTASFAVAFELPILGVGSYDVDRLTVYTSDGTLIVPNVTDKAHTTDGGGRPTSMTITCQAIPAVNSEITWSCSQ